MRPPEDWKKRLKERVSIEGTWNYFFNNVWNVKEDTLRSLQGLLEAYHDLMDEQLTADIFEIISLLKNPFWLLIDPNDKRERDIHDLFSISEYTTIIIKQAKDMIKRHKCLDYSSPLIITSSEEKPPKITSLESLRKEQYSIHEEILKQSIEFRDACTDASIKKARPPLSDST